MRLSKVIMVVVGTVAIFAVIAGFVTPRTAHPLVAMLVQVVHTLANPVPTVKADDRRYSWCRRPARLVTRPSSLRQLAGSSHSTLCQWAKPR